MKNIFSINNPIWAFINKLLNVIVLHVIWLVCSLPIITFGGATTALYYSCMKLVKDEDSHYVKAFFRSFKQNWKSGILLGILTLGTGLALAYAFWFYTNQQDTFLSFMGLMCIGAILVYAFVVCYVFPLFATFDDTIGRTLQNALFISVRHFPQTIIMIIITVAVYALPILLHFYLILLWGYGLIALLNSYLVVPIIKKYLPEEEVEKELNIDETPETDPAELQAMADAPALEEDALTEEAVEDNQRAETEDYQAAVAKAEAAEKAEVAKKTETTEEAAADEKANAEEKPNLAATKASVVGSEESTPHTHASDPQ